VSLREEVERFLVLEARFMDEHRYKEWLKLWTEDEALYWVPCNADDIDPKRHVSIIYDDRERLQQRVDRLASGASLAQEPPPRMRRIVSNIEIEPNGVMPGHDDPGEIRVASNFILAWARGETQQTWAGRSLHALIRSDGAFRIRRKTVLLINADQEMPLLQFLI